MSSALNGWKYDVMKFESRRPVDISAWVPPIKLNRKELRRDERGLGPGGGGGGVGGVAVAPMLGPDGKPVVGPDGALVMVDADGRPVQSLFASASTSTSAGAAVAAATAAGGKDKGKQPFGNGKKKFQKKTRQAFLVPEATRQLRKEERHPWVMEDASGKEVWVGKVEDLAKSDTHAFFMPAANDVFKFVPAHRWYKFQKKPSYHIPNLEEAESIVSFT
jgi:transcription initiation factor TFIIF subunit alpha